MLFSYTDLTALAAINPAIQQAATAQGLTIMPSIVQQGNFFEQFVLFFPDLAAIATLLLIIESFIFSYYIKSSPLGAIFAIAMLFIYTIISFYVANAAIQIARLAIFSGIISSANLLILIYINMPVILLFASCIDIIIAITAAVKT